MVIAISAARTAEVEALGYENNPFVAWLNIGADATLGGSSVITGGEPANAVTGSTYDKWRPVVDVSGEAKLAFDFGSAVNISFAAIAAHNLFDYTGSVRVERSDDAVTWTAAGAGDVTPTNNSPIAFRMVTTGQSHRYWRFRFFDMVQDDPLSVGVAFMGDDLIIPQRLYQGFEPVLTDTEVQLQSNVSVGAHLLGSSIISRGSTIAPSIDHIDATFIRSADWLLFQKAFNDGKGFFFAWRPEKYAQDIHYCAREGGTLRPPNSGPRDLMSVKFTARVYVNG